MIRNSTTTSIAAALAVAAGLLLDVSIASTFGAGRTSDAFFVAARIPLGFVAIVMVGANQALVPRISTWLEERGNSETWRLVSLTFVGTLLIGGGLVALNFVLAGPLIRVTAPGLPSSSAALAASVTRVMFLVVPLVSLAEVLRALLNALHSFFAPAFMNVVMNGLAAWLVFSSHGGDPHVIAWAYVIGATVQLLFMLLVSLVRGFRPKPTVALSDPELASTGRLVIRPLLGAGLNPLARVGEQLFVSFLPPGSITILNYGYRLISAIGGTVLFRSVMVVLLPRLTRATAAGDERDVRLMTRLGVRIMLWASIPLTALMAVLSAPAARAVFHRRQFTAADAAMLGTCLAVYSVSLVGSAIQRSFLAPFFARLNTRTPLRNTVYGVVANMAFLPLCILPWGFRSPRAIFGVALAYSLAQYVNVGHAWYRMRHDLGLRPRGIPEMLLRLGTAGLVTGGVLLAGRALFLDEAMHRWILLARTCLVGGLGLAVFVGAAALVGFTDVERFLVRGMRSANRSSNLRGIDEKGT